MIANSKDNPILYSATDVANYSFIVDDGITYLVMNTVSGEDSYIDDYTIAAGEPINGFNLAAWVRQRLVVDERHIDYGTGESFSSITAGTTLLGISDGGDFEIINSAPNSGYYFKVVEKNAGVGGNNVKVIICFAGVVEVLSLSVDTDITADLLGKSVGDLQENIAISDANVITGTLKYVTGYTGFSGDVSEQSGNYIALHFDANDGAAIQVEVTGGTRTHSGAVTLDSDGIALLRLVDNNDVINVTATKSGSTTITKKYTLNLTFNDT